MYPRIKQTFVIDEITVPDTQHILSQVHIDNIKYTHYPVDDKTVWTIHISDRPILQLFSRKNNVLTREPVYYNPQIQCVVSQKGAKLCHSLPPQTALNDYSSLFNAQSSVNTLNINGEACLAIYPDYTYDYNLRLFRNIHTNVCLFGYKLQ